MEPDLADDAVAYVRRFGTLVRRRREAMGLRLEDLAAAAGVGIRFVHELERGKPTCQIGRSLLVAAMVGLRPVDLLEADAAGQEDAPA